MCFLLFNTSQAGKGEKGDKGDSGSKGDKGDSGAASCKCPLQVTDIFLNCLRIVRDTLMWNGILIFFLASITGKVSISCLRRTNIYDHDLSFECF